MNIISQSKAIEELLNTNIVALPTETVYGLFGLGNSQEAVNKVYKIKKRPADNPLICHFYNYAQIQKHTINQPEYLETLIKYFCPGPITFLLELNPNSDLKPSTAGQTKICCRIPDNTITLEILEQVNIPLFGPSANSSTKVSGTNPKIIFADIGYSIAGTVDGGDCKIGLESTIIDCTNSSKIKILRPGAIGKKEIEIIINNKSISVIENESSTHTTPGAKYRHYSPRTKIIKIESFLFESELDGKRINQHHILGFHEDLELIQNNYSKISLGSIHNPSQIAHDLFQNLFRTDELNIEQIYFYFGPAASNLFDSTGSIQKAIVNRLEKAISKN